MKLLRMTATFGRLEQETLSLTEGLNVLQMPNEAGKSTWAEFLLAMLYGVDTSEREKTGVLPVKTKYQPWSGKPMEGVIELEHAGRRITLTRTSTARAPLGVFSAVYTDSGLPVEGMTGANCGEMLLGVPKSVYQRSAFVRQAGLGLTADADLEEAIPLVGGSYANTSDAGPSALHLDYERSSVGTGLGFFSACLGEPVRR